MIPAFDDILRKKDLSLEEIKVLLAAEGDEKERLLRRGLAVKLQHLDNYVHLRGLIEFGNVGEKNCFYCGLRSGNDRVERYCLSDEEVLDCARLAHELGYGSVALQSGERSDAAFIDRIERLVCKAASAVMRPSSTGSSAWSGKSRKSTTEASASRSRSESRRRKPTVDGSKPGRTDTCSASNRPTRNYTTRSIRRTACTTSATGSNAWRA